MLDGSWAQSLHQMLPLLTAEWAMWAVDAQGVFTIHEGPAGRGDARPDGHVGRSVWDVNWEDSAVLEFAHKVLEQPASVRITQGDERLLVVGIPIAEGGAMGFALVEASDADPHPLDESSTTATRVVELTYDIPELNASRGDLLVIRAEDPDEIGILRRTSLEELHELWCVLSPPPAAPAADGPDDGAAHRAPGSTRERSPHLRLLP